MYLLGGQLAAARRELEIAKSQTSSNYEKADYLILLAKIDAIHREPNRAKEAKKKLGEAAKDSQAPEFAIEIARIYAMVGDFVSARDFLARQTQGAPGLGKEYAAAGPFVDGMESIERHDFKKAVGQLASSFDKDHNPETAYFLAKAEMNLSDWNAAIDSFNFVTRNKVMVFNDSVASLIPLAEYDLSKCYRSEGKPSEALQHLASAQAMWKDADPELRTQFKGW